MLVAFYLVLAHGTGGEQYDWYMAGHNVVLDVLAELQTIHIGHHHVGDDEVGYFEVGLFESEHTVGSLGYLVSVLQDSAQVVAYVVVVVDDEQMWSFVGWDVVAMMVLRGLYVYLD